MKKERVSGLRATPYVPRATLIGVVLAGGQSTRMGRDKATLPFLQGRLIDFMVTLLKESLGLSTVLVSGKCEGFSCVHDRIPGLGPVGGIYSVASTVREKAGEVWLIVVPVDMPALTSELLQVLVQAFAHESAITPLDAIRFEGREMPFLLRLTEHVFQVLESLCKESTRQDTSPSSRSIKAFFNRLDFCEIDLPSSARQQYFANLNSPDAWREFEEKCNTCNT